MPNIGLPINQVSFVLAQPLTVNAFYYVITHIIKWPGLSNVTLHFLRCDYCKIDAEMAYSAALDVQ